jgi:hypothetical protein
MLLSCDWGTDPDHRNTGAPVLLVPSRIKSVTPGRTDTATTLLRYDASGMLIREIRPTTFREWDSLGRYAGVRQKDSTVYLEYVSWIGPDSAVRFQSSAVVIHDRYYNRHPNCWCADSIRHTVGDSVRATRKFEFDAHDHPLRVTLTWPDSSMDIVQAYTNTYDSTGRLIQVYAQDAESGTVLTTLRFIEYDTLKNVTEVRPRSGIVP